MKKIAALCIGGMLLLSLSAWGSSFKQEPANTDSDPIEQTTFAAETPGTLAYYAPWGKWYFFTENAAVQEVCMNLVRQCLVLSRLRPCREKYR